MNLQSLLIRLGRFVVLISLAAVLTACNLTSPPSDIVQKAIALQLGQTQQSLAQALGMPADADPKTAISHVAIAERKSELVGKLPTYHVQGTYDLTAAYGDEQINQKRNQFDVYVQEQIEGKTWRLLKPDVDADGKTLQWRSYLIQ